jgi:hypothetical protein
VPDDSDATDAFGNRPSATPPASPQPGTAAAPTAAGSGPIAGWYPDPGGSGGQRWWDGRQWHGVYGEPGVGGPVRRTDGFAIAALVFAILGGILLSVIFALVALSRIKSGKRQEGRGMAIAALWISGAWALLIAGLVALALTGVLDDRNVDKYTGEKREVARVIDRFEEEADDSPEAVCALMTQSLQDTLAAGSGSCANAIGHEDGIQAELDATSITLEGAGRATAVVDEDGDLLQMRFVREPDGWKIDEITTQ